MACSNAEQSTDHAVWFGRPGALSRRVLPCVRSTRTMTQAAPRHSYTLRDYLDVEEVSIVRHELIDGEIVALAGGTPEHAALAGAIPALLGRQLSGRPCRI